MNTTRKNTGLFLITGLLLASSLFAQGARKQPMGQSNQQYWLKFEKELGLQTRYSVDMEIQTMGMNMPSKVYRLDTKTRSELTMPFMNMKMVALQLPVNGKTVTYTLFPDKKKYCINPEAEADSGDEAAKPQYKLEELGTEVFEGATCKKRLMTVTLKDGTTSQMTMLFSPAQKNMPVKIDSQTKIVTEPGKEPMPVTSVILFKNYQFAAPDAGLFAIPKDYVQAASMSEIMMSGGMMGGLGQPQQAPAAGQPAAVQEALQRAQQEQKAEAAQKEAVKEGIGRGLRSLLGQ